ncbi:hypothetical protein ES332_D05G288500v1 [Gossypium tomentosum]|uniref:Uncharacterized protein n=1 Tax=Gossypium tomentosum TaxID=34277 RepID=A0A5D2L0P5_GOSTO|nr:hypothetical protein ES332_D05G288500v1 [Gossypium tomentosum]
MPHRIIVQCHIKVLHILVHLFEKLLLSVVLYHNVIPIAYNSEIRFSLKSQSAIAKEFKSTSISNISIK